MLNIIAYIGTAILAMLILHVVNYFILGRKTTVETAIDGYDYHVRAYHYARSFFLSCGDMIVLLTIIFWKGNSELTLFKALGVSAVITIVGAFAMMVATGMLDKNGKYTKPKVADTAVEDLKNKAYEEEKYIIPTYTLLTVANGVLVTVVLHIAEII